MNGGRAHRVGWAAREFHPWLLSLVLGWTGQATDWPQFLGPNRNGSTPDPVAASLGREGPARRWRFDVGAGFAGPVVTGDRVIIFHQVGEDEVVTALETATGKKRWEKRQPTTFVDSMGSGDGPRSTPCVADGRVFTFGADGRLSSWGLEDGKPLWTVDTQARFRADPGFFGFACSPLVISNLVLLNLGGQDGAGIAAFEAGTGKLAWKLKNHEAGYASPVAVTGARPLLALFFDREGLVGVELPGGAERFSHPWRSPMNASVNAASPVAFGDEVFLTASYDTGAVLLRRRGDSLSVVWSGDESLSAHFATPVLRDGFLYGFHGRQERGPEFRCIEWTTGKVRWSETGLGAGTVALAGDRLVVLLESGELIVATADPRAFSVLARAQVLGRVSRAPFALSDGWLFARDSRQVACFDLRPAASGAK